MELIPIPNLYYLLCDAWDLLEERDHALVSKLEGLSRVELLARVLSVSVHRLWKRGLDRAYHTLPPTGAEHAERGAHRDCIPGA